MAAAAGKGGRKPGATGCSLTVHVELKSFMLDLTPEAAAIGNRVLSR